MSLAPPRPAGTLKGLHAYDLRISTLQPGLQFYMTASENVEAVYLDRIILVREKSQQRAVENHP